MDCSAPAFPVHHQFLKLTQTHVHWVGDAIQPSHPLLSPSLAFNISQYRVLFKWISSSHQVAKLLGFQLQHQSFQWIFRVNFLYYWLVWSCRPRDSQESSAAPQSKSSNSSTFILIYDPTHLYLTTGETIALTIQTFVGKVISLHFTIVPRFVIR